MNVKSRGFEIVDESRLRTQAIYHLPSRGTVGSAGYDFYLPFDVTVEPHQMTEMI